MELNKLTKRKRWVSMLTSGAMLLGMFTTSALGAVTVHAADTVDYAKVPKLLITELVPDSTNLSGKSVDAYEFIEVYNNSKQPVSFKDYNLVYHNDSDSSNTVWSAVYNNDMTIPAQQAIVLWVMNADNTNETADAFNNNYHTNLQENVNLFRLSGGGGMHNSQPRTLVIQDKSGKELASASYQNDIQTVKDMGILYSYPVDGTTKQVMMPNPGTVAASPGTVIPAQVPGTASDEGTQGPALPNQPPVITHTPVTQSGTAENLMITAQITNPESGNGQDVLTAELFYKTASQTSFTSVALNLASGDEYRAVIPREALNEAELQYYLQVKDSANTVKTDTYTVSVSLPDFDVTKVPPILITELVPNSTNVGSADGYEFIEIYNNTNQPISFKDYKLYYRYTDSGPDADIIWPSDQEDLVIPAQKPFVFWVINSQNKSKTVADFNTLYHTSLVENQNIVKVYSDGMANTSKRGVAIATNTHVDVSSAYYDGSLKDETKENKGVYYKFPMNGSTTMIKYSAGAKEATPGSVEPGQAPDQMIIVKPDTAAPTFADLTGIQAIDQSKNLEIKADAKDDRQVKTMALYYKSDKQMEYTKRYLLESYNDSLYHYTLYSPDLIGRSEIEYYFTVSDGTNEIQSPKYKVQITGGKERSDLRLNVKNGEIVKGTRVVKGTAEQAGPDTLKLVIDGQDLSPAAFPAVENDAYFAFEANSVNYYFKNGVTIGKEILYTFQDPINTYTTLSVPIQSDRLKQSGNVISIRAGSKSSPFDDRAEENKDDFTVKNVRLVFADGTEYWDSRYANKDQEIKMGDSSGRFPAVDFNFDLPANKLASKAYAWNTAAVQDGPHQVTVSSEVYGAVTAQIIVDNTAPVIVPSVEDGQTYRGFLTIDAQVTDALAGVEKTEVTLDGKELMLPYATTSSELSAGKHELVIHAVDKVGNAAEKKVSFEVPQENPLQPEVVYPQNESANVEQNAGLTVKVTDPTNDKMNVSFYRGFSYDANHRDGLTAFKNASDIEPPSQLKPAGEQPLSEEEYNQIREVDGKYLESDSIEQFPYHRFEVKLDDAVKPTDRVEIEWKGKSLEGRKVSLYAWSPTANQWKQLDTRVAGTEDFELLATVQAGDYSVNGTIHTIVQDELPVSQQPYDFSMVWMSDTQYYSESYPEIYEGNVKWIVDHQKDMNIQYVIHTGDIVDEADKEYQWLEADKDMKVLEDAKIPYGVLAGNHDVSHQTSDYTQYWKYFGENRFKVQPTFGGSYQNNRGHYDLISAGGNDFIVVYMGWNIGDEQIEWVNEVVKQYPDRKAILNFHEYLLVSGNRAPVSDLIFERVVKPNKNVFAVLSGHYHDAEELIDPIDDDGDGIPDRNVYQMLADYQGAEKGGLGYIRLLQFDIKNNKIYVKTYSPYLDDYNYYDPKEYPGKDEFALDVDLKPMVKRVATDYMGVKVYTDQQIGKAEGVASSQQASVYWSGLAANRYYQWYAAVEDGNSGHTVSDIWGFTTRGPKKDHSSGSSGSTGTGSGNPGTPEAPEQPAAPGSDGKPSVTPTPGQTPNPAPAPGGHPFKDVTESYAWAQAAIQQLASKGIIQGTSETTFEPQKHITRADFMTLLVRALGLKADFDSNFSDVQPGDYYFEALGIAKKLGISDGIGDNKFDPRAQITRQDLMVLSARALQASSLLHNQGKAADLQEFKDHAQVASYAKEAVASMVKAGFVEGSNDGLQPQGYATRAETAVIMYRIFMKK
ncbi:S-layer homology domain-containing protein [Paenibacillus rigui]|nr:S-layer homology domain-containing protein [Paenibacillus rigui]